MPVRTLQAEPIVQGLYFPEGARWQADRLLFAEIHAGRLSSVDDAGRHEVIAEFNSPCSGLGTLPDGSVVVSLMQRSQLVRVAAGAVTLHADLGDLGFDHINDIITDADGRTYVDALMYHMHWDPALIVDGVEIRVHQNKARETPTSVTDSLILVDAGGNARVVATDLLGPNGLAITNDGVTLVVAEWRINRITQFGIARDGALGDRRLFGNAPSLPDGLCADSANAIWCSSPESGDCVRMLPGGEIVARVKPRAGNRVTACALGGPNLQTLYLTTDRHPELGSGAIEAVDVDVPGVAA